MLEGLGHETIAEHARVFRRHRIVDAADFIGGLDNCLVERVFGGEVVGHLAALRREQTLVIGAGLLHVLERCERVADGQLVAQQVGQFEEIRRHRQAGLVVGECRNDRGDLRLRGGLVLDELDGADQTGDAHQQAMLERAPELRVAHLQLPQRLCRYAIKPAVRLCPDAGLCKELAIGVRHAGNDRRAIAHAAKRSQPLAAFIFERKAAATGRQQ